MNTIEVILFFFISSMLFAQDEIIIDGRPCGLHGSAKNGSIEYYENEYKNRYNFPETKDYDNSITLKELLIWKGTKDNNYQDRAVEISGYVFDIKVGGIESCNCKATDPLIRDTHIELTVDNVETGPDKRLIAEVTPRFRKLLLKNGEDWNTETLKHKIKGKYVKIRGWLFLDRSHLSQSFADNPGNKNDWRATGWEVHPVSSIEVIDPPKIAENNSNKSDISSKGITSPNQSGNENKKVTKTDSKKTESKSDSPVDIMNMIAIILIGAILSLTGQVIRVFIGMKKVFVKANSTGSSFRKIFDLKRFLMSVLISIVIGSVAGVSITILKPDIQISKSLIIAFIALGYAVTDFLEGLFRRNK